MNTHEEYVSIETAKLLKRAGFDWECRVARSDMSEKIYKEYPAPTQAVAMRWLREVKNCDIDIVLHSGKDAYYIAWVQFLDWDITPNDMAGKFPTYEQAAEAGIQECLKMILNEQEQ